MYSNSALPFLGYFLMLASHTWVDMFNILFVVFVVKKSKPECPQLRV
jgi:hypothetical protein